MVQAEVVNGELLQECLEPEEFASNSKGHHTWMMLSNTFLLEPVLQMTYSRFFTYAFFSFKH